MVDKKYVGLLSQVLELLDTACQANLELIHFYVAGQADEAMHLLQDLRTAIHSIACTALASQLDHSGCPEMMENIEDTLGEITQAIQQDRKERAAMKMEFQLFPFLRCLREAFYFWGTIYPDKKRMDHYYREEFAKHYQNLYISGDDPLSFRLSIVVPAYNHLDTTKQCIEQLLKETDFEKLNAELILIDHGSTDGTLEYFESLNTGKVIHFKRNARMYMLATLFQVCQGKYFAFINNDILVTHQWAEILLNCLDSNEQIISVAAATPNISNLQACSVPNYAPREFIAWANERNSPDPSCWNDRVRLMPSLGIYRADTVNEIGFADPYFYSMEYWDDDFSLRARRAGYRQILCEDVSCYHFGSVTGKDAQRKESTLVYGRELFQKKNRVDAWGNGFCYDYYGVDLLKKAISQETCINILGLDCGMGDTPLQIRNELLHRGQQCQTYQLTSVKEYLADIEPHSSQAYYIADLAAGLKEHFQTILFQGAFLGRDIGEYTNFPQLLAAVAHCLKSNGCLIFSCTNPFFAITLHALLHFILPGNKDQCVLTNPETVKREAERHFSQVQMVGLEQDVTGLKEFIAQHYGPGRHAAQMVQKMKVERYYFVCRK